MTDVRCQGTSGGCGGGALSPYTGDLRFDTTFTVTDKANTPFNKSGTLTDLPVRFRVPCLPTGSSTIGSTCSVATTINSVVGASAIVAGQRAIWQPTGRVQLYDGGSLGIWSASDATLFAVAGLFAP
jgi:hypothetical protein